MEIGEYRHRVRVELTGAAVPDGDGGFTTGFAPADPAEWRVQHYASERTRFRAIRRRHRDGASDTRRARPVSSGATTEARILFDEYDEAGALALAHVLNVVGVVNRDMRRIVTEALVAEVVS